MKLTNAQKAGIIAALNAALGLAVVFGAPLTEQQIGAILGFANAFLGLFVLGTYKDSPKRIPDEPGV
jgi:predicted MFS family arabinose efflux permease